MDILKKSENVQISFCIADITIMLRAIHPFQITEAFYPFLSEKKKNHIKVVFLETERMNFSNQQLMAIESNFSVYHDEEGYYRIFHHSVFPKDDRPYAIGRIKSDFIEEIQYIKSSSKILNDSQSLFAHIAFEELMFRHGAMILHASFVNAKYGGILFTGPSGIGKSTQAELWVKYRNAELINGDRTILRKRDGVWYAYGSPYAGSSRCYVNKSCEIKAIVVLGKKEGYKLQRLKQSVAFIKVYSETTVNTWNPAYVEGISDMIGDIVEKVPVYMLECLPDIKAVELLSETLEKRTNYES